MFCFSASELAAGLLLLFSPFPPLSCPEAAPQIQLEVREALQAPPAESGAKSRPQMRLGRFRAQKTRPGPVAANVVHFRLNNM